MSNNAKTSQTPTCPLYSPTDETTCAWGTTTLKCDANLSRKLIFFFFGNV